MADQKKVRFHIKPHKKNILIQFCNFRKKADLLSLQKQVRYTESVILLGNITTLPKSKFFCYFDGQKLILHLFRILLAIAFTISLICCAFLIKNAYVRWIDHPILISFATKPASVWKVPFPAITICPEVKTQKRLFDFAQTLEKLVFNASQPIGNDTYVCNGICVNSCEIICEYRLFLDMKNFKSYLICARNGWLLICHYRH